MEAEPSRDEPIFRNGQHYTGRWGAPAMYALEGISIGFQLGGEATDFVLLVMNPEGAEFSLLAETGFALLQENSSCLFYQPALT